MAVIVRQCCCGCDLRTGVMIIAILYLICQSYNIYSNINNGSKLEKLKPDISTSTLVPPKVKSNINGIIKFEYIVAGFCGIDILVNLLLLIAVNVRNRLLCLFWCTWRTLFVLISLGYLIFLVSLWTYYFVLTLVYVGGGLLAIYFLIVVYSYAELIKEEDQQIQVPMFPQAQTQGLPGFNGPPPYKKMEPE